MSEDTTTGAEALLHTLVGAGVDTCFMNPGTSEMHFVRALDSAPEMRGVLTLFEGVATGAADGFARVTGRPAAALLHLGPGLGNGYANLHNARRAHSPVVCVVGVHASDHAPYDAPLQSEVEAMARTLDGWVHTSGTARGLAADAARAVSASRRGGGQVATLVVPADASWQTGARAASPRPVPDRQPVDEADRATALDWALRGAGTLLLIGGPALTERGLRAAAAVAVGTGATVLIETFPASLEQGGEVPGFDRVAYLAEAADKQLVDIERIVLVGAAAPVTFFGYPGRSGDLSGDRAVLALCDVDQDAEAALEALADELAADAGTNPAPVPATAPSRRRSDLDPTPREDADLDFANVAAIIAETLPEDTIVVDEMNTSGSALPAALRTAPRHTLLTLTGGAIGQGMPVATGAAVAAPERRVLSLEADGSAMYTIQSLWTQARENLAVTTVLLNNSAYAILRMELLRTGAGEAGSAARRMLDLDSPMIDFATVSEGLGVPARRVRTTDELEDALREAYDTEGPFLVETMIPPIV